MTARRAGPQTRTPLRAPELTDREFEVARLVAHGLRNREIAERLAVSVRTAESHVERIRRKLGFRSRVEIGRWITQRDVLDAIGRTLPSR